MEEVFAKCVFHKDRVVFFPQNNGETSPDAAPDFIFRQVSGDILEQFLSSFAAWGPRFDK